METNQPDTNPSGLKSTTEIKKNLTDSIQPTSFELKDCDYVLIFQFPHPSPVKDQEKSITTLKSILTRLVHLGLIVKTRQIATGKLGIFVKAPVQVLMREAYRTR